MTFIFKNNFELHADYLFLLMLLTYHSRQRMISEALDMRVVVGRVRHSWCMCVVIHGYGWLGGGRNTGDGWYAYGTKSERIVACRVMPEHIPSAR